MNCCWFIQLFTIGGCLNGRAISTFGASYDINDLHSHSLEIVGRPAGSLNAEEQARLLLVYLGVKILIKCDTFIQLYYAENLTANLLRLQRNNY